MSYTRRTLEERFWSFVDKSAGPDGCWIWTGCRTPDGYGRLSIGSHGKVYAHRLSWEVHHGPIPGGRLVCHNCPGGDSPACVNPAHLFLGTIQDNNRDARHKGRSVAPRGEKNGSAKLTALQVLEIRALAEKGIAQTEIARLFPVVDYAHINNIVLRKRWKHI